MLYKFSWIAIMGLLIAGAILPMFTFTKFYFFDDTFSLLSGIFHLLSEDQYVLFVIIFSFSILLPLYKMFVLFGVIFGMIKPGEKMKKTLHRVAILGKWSMLDVFVVAMLVVTIKLGFVLSVETHIGIYMFAFAVLASMTLTHMTCKAENVFQTA